MHSSTLKFIMYVFILKDNDDHVVTNIEQHLKIRKDYLEKCLKIKNRRLIS